MLKRQVWMTDDDEFEHVVKNLQRMPRLNDQYKNHLYIEEFTKNCNVMFVYETYILEEEADAKFSLDNIWKLFQEDLLPNNNFCRQILNCMKTWNYLQKTSSLSLNTEIIKQTHGLMTEDEKDILVGEYRTSPVFAGYHVFAPAGYTERYMKDAILRFHETKKDDLIEDGNGRICRLILAHVLMQMECCLFPVILSSFYRRGRRHYIRAVRMFDRKPSVL